MQWTVEVTNVASPDPDLACLVGVPRLFDLLKIKDEALRPAFFFAMGNTLVATDLDQASRIAYGRDSRFRRVVTLQGQLIAESGTMSGGGGRPSRGRMQLGSAAPRGNVDAKAAAAELAAAEQQLEQANQVGRGGVAGWLGVVVVGRLGSWEAACSRVL